MDLLSGRISAMAESATVAMNLKSSELKAKGVDIINLSVGEPDFPTPQYIKDAAIKAMEQNYTFYSPVQGYPDLVQAIIKKLKSDNQLEYQPSQILVTVGAKHAIANAILALVDEGDEVIVPAPYWVSYMEQVRLANGVNVVINTGLDTGYKITAEMLAKAITPKTKALILCSPSNPTGAVYSYNELKLLANVLIKHPRIMVIADEIYEHISFVGKHSSMAQFPEMKDRVVLVNGVSKAFAMTGWRIGYLAAPQWLTKACNKLQGQITTGACSIAQKAAVAALNGDLTLVESMRLAFLRRRDLMMNWMNKIDGIICNIPDGAFYVFPDISSFFGKSDGVFTINNSDDMALYLLENAHIATVAGSGFGNDNCIRIAYATDDQQLDIAMKRMQSALLRLK